MKNSDMPASPTLYMEQSNGSGELYSDNAGLTKREAFAMAAMQGWLARCANVPHTHKLEPESMAEVAVGMADALLKQLEVK